MPLFLNKPKGTGGGSVDLSNLYTKTEIDNMLQNYSAGDPVGIYQTYAELIASNSEETVAIILKDESKTPIDETHVYEYDGASWIHVGRIGNGTVDLTNIYTKNQIDTMLQNFSSSNPVEIYQTYADLSASVGKIDSVALVLKDESQVPAGTTRVYEHDGTDWIYVGELSSNSTISSILAANVIETSDKQFISASKKSQIDSNMTELASHSLRISNLENSGIPGSSTDEKVKLNALDSSGGYLSEKIDNATLNIVNNKLVVQGMDRLISTVDELNSLTGITGNVQAQINALTNIGNFTGSAPTYAEISVVNPSPIANDMIIVVADETKLGESTIYVYSGSGWSYGGKFTATVRDFVTKPLLLETETDGVLPKAKYEKQNALETPIVNTLNNFQAKNVEDALNELFQYTNSMRTDIAKTIGSPLIPSDTKSIMISKIENIKKNLAQAITEKGVIAYSYNTLEEMIYKVLAIPNVNIQGAVQKKSRINVTAPSVITVNLKEAIPLSDITATLIEYIPGANGVLHYAITFDNGDSSDFLPNNNVKYDGVMKLTNKYVSQMTKDNTWTEEGQLMRQTIKNNNSFDLLSLELEIK